ncbi:RNA polymerase sigma factor SigM [Actinomycetospora corticicola]|uniref:RNA polymerase sigma-70 factor (ECF subfamily) n=1 Tax=Actinomycetospora corticicola TaxID=663602 RepID=A0A7Y9E2B0_9PSEU|nr:sigma-70 family RNA polymerase sigma factor [Actinomycetospora corticicola]NYD39866.1 RNA polymerase sigma-70 factor (ECF subfamily) [Actinomycetospora corticicola]
MSGTHHDSGKTYEGATDGELIQAWLAGDNNGLSELVARHHAWLTASVRYLSFGERDVEAVVQDVWVDVMRGAGGYRGTGSVRAWLETIVRRRIRSTWRGRRVRPQVLTETMDETARVEVGLAERVEQRLALHDLLAALPEGQREAIWCVDVLGLSVSEAAEALGVPAGTIKSRCNRGREYMRVRLSAE